jgi:WW domain-binding protein 4
VQKRLNEIGKQSAADQKEQNKINEQLRRMNDAAMQSYAQDISSGADISSRAIARANAKKAVDPMALADYESDEEFGPNVSKRAAAAAASAAAEVKDPSLWCEARDAEGNTYYWNVKTNESKWTKPKEGFMSLDEYEKLNEIAIKQQEEFKQKEMKNTIENADEIASKYNREQLKKYKKITEEPKPVAEASTSYAGQYGGQPFGKWQTVEAKRDIKPVDLELPKQEFTYVAVQASSVDEPPVKKFKEKTITKLEDVSDVPSFFKKRKTNGARNIRRGTDDSST